MTKKAFSAICEKNNVAWKVDEASNTLDVDPAAGFVFTGTGLHFLTIYLDDWRRPDAYAFVADDLSMGVEPCSIDACQYCEDNVVTPA